MYEGESNLVDENRFLGEFVLQDLLPRPKGEKDRLKVTFEIDVNGILNITAVDVAGGSTAKI